MEALKSRGKGLKHTQTRRKANRRISRVLAVLRLEELSSEEKKEERRHDHFRGKIKEFVPKAIKRYEGREKSLNPKGG